MRRCLSGKVHAVVMLVTGAAGFVGARLCGRLLERGEHVVALWHHDGTRLEPLMDDERLIALQGDIQEPAGWLEGLPADDRVDTVFHLATQPPTGDDTARTTNVDGTAALLDAMTSRGAYRWVNTSSMSVYDFLTPERVPVVESDPARPLQAYGQEKLRAEMLLAESATAGVSAISLRLAGLFGPGRASGAVYHFVRRALDGETICIDEDRRIDILHVEDAVTAILLAHERLPALCAGGGHRVYNIGRGEATALSVLALAAGRATDEPVEARVAAPGSTFYMSIDAAARDLGFRPSPLQEGLDDVADAMLAADEVSA